MKLKTSIENLKPYITSERNRDQQGWLYIDWNESGYNNVAVMNHLMRILPTVDLNLYPVENPKRLMKLLGYYSGAGEENISIYSGSDAALKDIFDLYLNQGDKVFRVNPNYTQIDTYIHTNGGEIVAYNPENIFDIKESDIIDHIPGDVKIIYISNPNNPIGYLHDREFINELCESYPNAIVILDEAYGEFCEFLPDWTKASRQHKNLIITRTFSKAFGLASLRLGYIITNTDNINDLNKIKNIKQVNQIALLAGEYLLEDPESMFDYVNEISDARELISSSITNIKITDYTNFFLYKPKDDTFNQFMLDNKVLVRDRSTLYGLQGYYRITIPSLKDTIKLIELIKEYESE